MTIKQRLCATAVQRGLWAHLTADQLLYNELSNSSLSALDYDGRSVAVTIHSDLSDDGCAWLQSVVNSYVYPLMALACVLGNCVNVCVYRETFFAGSPCVGLLMAKALANMAFALSLTMTMVHAWLDATFPQPTVEYIYWYTKNPSTIATNVSGTLSNWFTLIITIETLWCIWKPIDFARTFNRRLIRCLLLLCLMLAVCMHLPAALLYKVSRIDRAFSRPCPLNVTLFAKTNRFSSSNSSQEHDWYWGWFAAYTWTYALSSMVVPNLIMFFAAFLIARSFKAYTTGAQCSERRRCVMNITWATTLCHIFAETPGSVMYLLRAFFMYQTSEMSADLRATLCVGSVVSNTLTLINTALPFFIFFAWNDKYRTLSIDLGLWMKAYLCCQQPPTNSNYYARAAYSWSNYQKPLPIGNEADQFGSHGSAGEQPPQQHQPRLSIDEHHCSMHRVGTKLGSLKLRPPPSSSVILLANGYTNEGNGAGKAHLRTTSGAGNCDWLMQPRSAEAEV